MSDSEDVPVTKGSGNVFADLGLSNADELLVKADLAIAIKRELDARGWTQQQAAERVQLSQPQISKIRRMQTEEFSIAKLQEVLRYLGVDVQIHLNKREDGGIGTLRVRDNIAVAGTPIRSLKAHRLTGAQIVALTRRGRR